MSDAKPIRHRFFTGVLVLAAKDLHAIIREKTTLIFTVFFPLFIGITFGVIFSGGGGDSRIGVLVLDDDSTPASARFVELLAENPALSLTDATDRDVVELAIRESRAPAAIVIEPGFAEALRTSMLGDPPRITLLIDPARRAERPLLEGVLAERSMMLLSERFAEPTTRNDSLAAIRQRIADNQDIPVGERLAWLAALDQILRLPAPTPGEAATPDQAEASGTPTFRPIDTEVRVISSSRISPPSAFHVTFAMAMVWAIMGCSATFAVSLVTERTSGTLLRLRAAPIGPLAIVLGKAIACFIASMIVAAMMLFIGMLGFGVRPGSMIALLIAVPAAAVAFAGIMMLLSVLGSNKSSASQLAWAAMLLIAVPGGGMLPLIAMPGWLAAIGRFSPMRWAILAIEGGLWRGFSIAQLMPSVGVLMAFAFGAFVLGVVLFRWADDTNQ